MPAVDVTTEVNEFLERISGVMPDLSQWSVKQSLSEEGKTQIEITYPGDSVFLTEGVSMQDDLMKFDSGLFAERDNHLYSTLSWMPEPEYQPFKPNWHTTQLDKNLYTAITFPPSHENLLATFELYAHLCFLKKMAEEHQKTMPTLHDFWLAILMQARTICNDKRSSSLSPQKERLSRNRELLIALRMMKATFDDLNGNHIQAVERLGVGIFKNHGSIFAKWLAELKMQCLNNMTNSTAKPFVSAVYHAAKDVVNTNNSNILVMLNKGLDAAINAIENPNSPGVMETLFTRSQQAQGRPHRGLQVLGAAMAVLGVGLIVAGALFLLTSLIPLPHTPVTFGLGVGAIALGAISLCGGATLFSVKRKKGMSSALENMHHHIDSHQLSSKRA